MLCEFFLFLLFEAWKRRLILFAISKGGIGLLIPFFLFNFFGVAIGFIGGGCAGLWGRVFNNWVY